MKFTVDIEEFWLDEDDDLTDALQRHVTNSVISSISKTIKDKVEDCLTKKLEKIMLDKVEASIDIHISNMIESGVIKNCGNQVPIVEHMQKLFNNDRGWSSLESHVKKYSEKFAKNMVIQYDALFANKIVSNMKEQGLLREDVVNNLLGRD